MVRTVIGVTQSERDRDVGKEVSSVPNPSVFFGSHNGKCINRGSVEGRYKKEGFLYTN